MTMRIMLPASQSEFERMRDVFFGRHILQILKSIICLITIDVIDLLTIGHWTDEGAHDKTMDVLVAPSIILIQHDAEIPEFRRPLLEDGTLQLSATNAAPIRDFVSVLKADDRTPFLTRLIHEWWIGNVPPTAALADVADRRLADAVAFCKNRLGLSGAADGIDIIRRQLGFAIRLAGMGFRHNGTTNYSAVGTS